MQAKKATTQTSNTTMVSVKKTSTTRMAMPLCEPQRNVNHHYSIKNHFVNEGNGHTEYKNRNKNVKIHYSININERHVESDDQTDHENSSIN